MLRTWSDSASLCSSSFTAAIGSAFTLFSVFKENLAATLFAVEFSQGGEDLSPGAHTSASFRCPTGGGCSQGLGLGLLRRGARVLAFSPPRQDFERRDFVAGSKDSLPSGGSLLPAVLAGCLHFLFAVPARPQPRPRPPCRPRDSLHSGRSSGSGSWQDGTSMSTALRLSFAPDMTSCDQLVGDHRRGNYTGQT